MAAIHFESSVDNSKLNKGFKESEQTVEDFVKKVEKSGGIIGDFATQSAKQMKESITVQKNAINELKQQIKELENVTKSGGGTYKQNLQAQGELARAKKNLAGEETTLIAMQKAQVAGNNVEAQSQIPIIGGLWKWAAGLATVTAAMKIGKAIIESTDDAADKFHEVITASTSAVQYFFKSIASGDWSNFLDGMGEAIKGAVEFEHKMERLKDLKNEQLIKSAESFTKIGGLRAQTYETTDPKELKRLLGEIIIEQESNFKKEQAIREQEKSAILEKAATDNGISKEKIENYVREFSSLEKMIELGKEYNRLTAEVNKPRIQIPGTFAPLTGGSSEDAKAKLLLLGAGAAEAGKYVIQIGKVTDAVKKYSAEAIAAEEKAKGAFDNANRRDKERLKNIGKKEEEDRAAAAKKAKEEAELENRIKATQEAMKGASGQKLKDLAAGLVLLEKELALRNEILRQANQSAWTDQFKGESMKPMTSIGTKPISKVGALKITDGVLMELTAIDKKGRETFAKVKTENKELFKNATDLAKKADKDQEKLDKEKLERQQDLLNYSHQFTSELIQQLGLSEKQAAQAQNMVDAMFSLASGNPLKAAFSAGSMLFSAFSGNDKTDTSVLALERINNLLEHQSAILANLSGANYFQLAEKQYKDLGELIDENTKKLQNARIMNITGVSDYLKFDTEHFIKAYTAGTILLNESQTEWITSIIEAQKQRAELLQDTFREALGFDSSDVSDSIFTGIWDGLKLGENALGDFSASFGDLMKKALMQSITEGFNLKLTEGWMSDFTELMKGGLTDDERARLEQDYIKLIQEEQVKIDEVKKITEKYTTAATAESSLTGQIKSISEDTASMIAGRLMAVNVDMKTGLEIGYDSLDIMNMSVGHLDKIQKNTFDTVQQLIISNGELVKMNATLKAQL
jgi:hypothetical protein